MSFGTCTKWRNGGGGQTLANTCLWICVALRICYTVHETRNAGSKRWPVHLCRYVLLLLLGLKAGGFNVEPNYVADDVEFVAPQAAGAYVVTPSDLGVMLCLKSGKSQ